MDPYAWRADWWALVVVPSLAVAYVVAARRSPPSRARAVAFGAGLVLALAVLVTPVETIAIHYLLSAHLLQNVVLAEWAPALLVLGIPPALGRRFQPSPFLTLPLWLASSYAWHIPAVYDAALRHPDSLLALEHASFFITGVLLWWPVIHGTMSNGAKAAYLFAAFVLASPLGLLLALLPTPIYDFYEHAPSLWGIGHLADQQIAGLTMAVEQALVFFAAFVLFLRRFMASEELAGAFSESRR